MRDITAFLVALLAAAPVAAQSIGGTRQREPPMLIRFMAGMAALLVPALLIVAAIVCWAVIRRSSLRYLAVGIFAALLFGNVLRLIAGKATAVAREDRFAELCTKYSEPELLGTRVGVAMLLADYDWTAFKTDPTARTPLGFIRRICWSVSCSLPSRLILLIPLGSARLSRWCA